MRLGAALAGLWQPSLARRLLGAQLLLMVLLWLMLIAMLLYRSQRDESELAADARYAMILQSASALADRPFQQHAALAAIDRFQREADGVEDEPLMRISMLVRRHGRLLYASPGTPPALMTRRLGVIGQVTAGGRSWRARTLRDPASGIEVTLVKPAEAINVLFSFTSHGFLLLPLAISLPFLALPAWLSLRVALRPWRRLNRELMARGPDALEPLTFRPAHRELRPLADSLDGLLARLRDGVARERAFIADAAHELRTPVAALRINVEALQQIAVAAPLEQELLRGIVSGSERAARVIEQLLALMRADGGDGAPVRLDLDGLLRERLDALAPLAQRRKVRLELRPELRTAGAAVILGQPALLVSLVDNLLDNAIKYSPAGAAVIVSLERADDALRMLIEDQGPGIPAALRERVFDRFYRVPDQDQPGSGLGLAIVRANARRHGAEVTLAAGRGGRGLLAQVRFPAPPSSSTLHAGAPPSA
jgi:two-component system sensor histidine kinase QseC